MIRRFSVSSIAVLGLAVSFFVLPGSVAASPTLDTEEKLEVCLAKNSKLAVLMLIDESKSLRELKSGDSTKLGNDPSDSRVPALESVVRVLASAVESSRLVTNDKSLDVAIAIAGFGDGYNERLGFRSLDSKNVEAVVGALQDQRERDSDLHTRYHTALDGSLDSFNDYSNSPEVCRLLVWFSDGEHDDDNTLGFIARERDQIQKLLCGNGGTVDQLRLAGVNIVAAGLNPDESKLGLMQLIAEGGSGYKVNSNNKEGTVPVSVNACGETNPSGKYALATNADEIIDKLFEVLESIPGIPNPKDSIKIAPTTGVDCPDDSGSCSSVEFEVDESIASFQILAQRPSSAVEVVLTTNEGQRHITLVRSPAGSASDKSSSINKNTVQTTPVTAKKVFISVNRKKENPIEGKWKLEFLGEGAQESKGTVNFVGSAEIEIIDANDQKISNNELKIGRFEAETLGIRVVSKTPGSSIRNLEVEFASFEAVEKLFVERDPADRNLFILSEAEIERALNVDNLKKLSSTDLIVRPVGDVPGLKFADGRPVPVDFGSGERFTVLVSNGAGLPSFVRSEGVLLFEGTPKQSITLIFLGPDSGDGLVTFKDAIEAPGTKVNLDLIQRDPCVVQQQKEVACIVELIPDQEAFSKFKTAIAVTYAGIDTGKPPIDGEIPLDVSMLRQPSVGRGITAALALLVGFLVIQGLVRYLLAYLLSRFAPLAATARRVRLDAVVDQSGALSLNPMKTNPSHSDEGFALEVTDSVQSFNVFGYDFSVSVLQTFLHSTAAPVGRVISPSTFVIGSRGYARSKEEIDSSTGHVSLVLRGQWIVGIKSGDLQRLLNGDASVAAEVVAFLEPYEAGVGIDRDQQLSDLAFSISASNLEAELKEILDAERAKTSAEEGDELTEGAGLQGIPDPGDPFGGTSTGDESDPFGASSFSQSAPEPASESKRRKRRGRRSESEEIKASQPEQSDTTENLDPFA